MNRSQISIAVAGVTAAILAAGGVALTTYAASSPFPDHEPVQVDHSSVTPTRGIVPAEDRVPALRDDHGRHRGEARKGHHHGREAEPGDDRGGREAEPGDDHGDDSVNSGPGSTSSGSGSDDGGHHSGGDDSGSGGHGSDD